MKRISSTIACGSLGVIFFVLASVIATIDAADDSYDYCPARDGLFPADPSQLWAQVEGLAGLCPPKTLGSKVLGLFLPGDYYPISGAVMGAAFAEVKGATYDVVCVIVKSQNAAAPVTLFDSPRFVTPIGVLYCDTIAARDVAQKLPWINISRACPDKDFWFQLPFIQYCLGSPRIFPIEVGKLSFSEIDALTEVIKKQFENKRVLTLVVSDLAYDEDARAIAKLDNVGLPLLEKLDREMLSTRVDSGYTEIEAADAAYLGMSLIKKFGATTGEVLQHSATLGMPRKMRKGLASIVWMNTGTRCRETVLSPADGMALLEVSKSIVAGKKFQSQIPKNLYEQSAGVFVTIEKNGKVIARAGDLFSSMNLVDAVIKFSKIIVSTKKLQRLTKEQLDGATLVVSVAKPTANVVLPASYMGIYIRQDKNVSITLPNEDTEFSPKQRLERACLRTGLYSQSWCSPETYVHYFTVMSFAGQINE